MSYTTLNQLKDSLSAAVASTSGISGFYMMDESEINKVHNVLYPALFVDVPNSSIENINKGWEDYEISCQILNPENKSATDSYSIKFYDDALSLFDGVIHHLMKQRGGDYVLDNSSVSIERVSNVGNDLCIGCKITFNLIVPSVLIGTYVTQPIPTTGLFAHFNIDDAILGNRTLTWRAKGWTNSAQVFYEINHVSGSVTPLYNDLGNSLIFNGSNQIGRGSGIELRHLSLGKRSFSFVFKCHIPQFPGINQGNSTEGYLMSTLPDINGYSVAVKIIASGTYQGRLQIQKIDSRGFQSAMTPMSITPITSSDGYASLGIENDYVNQRSYISVNGARIAILFIYVDFYLSDANLHVGSAHQGFGGGSDSLGLEMQLKDIIIYDRVLSTDLDTVNEYLKAN